MIDIIDIIFKAVFSFVFFSLFLSMLINRIKELIITKREFSSYEKHLLEDELNKAKEQLKKYKDQSELINRLNEELNKAHKQEISFNKSENSYTELKSELQTAKRLANKKIESLEEENIELIKQRNALNARCNELSKENKYLNFEISRYINNLQTSPTQPFNIPYELYQNGIKDGCFNKALSDDISMRILDVSKINEITSIEDTIEITPETSRTEDNFKTSLSSCTCKDFLYNHRPKKAACKHMFTLAMQLGLITIAEKPIRPPQTKKR